MATRRTTPIASTARADRPRPPPARERLLAAAMHLVQTEGLPGLSQGRAAGAAGLRQSHLTYYFPTRKDLIKALAQQLHAEMVQTMSAPAANGHTRLTVNMARKFFAARIRDPLLPRLMMALIAAADEDPSLRGWLTDFETEALATLRDIVGRLGLQPSEDELALFHACIVGTAILSTQHDTRSAGDRASRLVCRAFDRLVEAATPQKRSKARATRRASPRT